MRTFQDGVKRLAITSTVWENDGTDFEWIRNLGQRRGRDISRGVLASGVIPEIQAYTPTSRLFDIVLERV
jgi:hypothetical protein